MHWFHHQNFYLIVSSWPKFFVKWHLLSFDLSLSISLTLFWKLSNSMLVHFDRSSAAVLHEHSLFSKHIPVIIVTLFWKPLYMTYVWLSLLSHWKRGDFMRLLILKRKIWWPLNDDREKNIFFKFVDPCRELNQGKAFSIVPILMTLNPGNLGEMPQYWPLYYPDIFIRRNVS